MKKYLKNEHGLTLIELLAVIVIGTIVMVLISNIHIFSQKEYKKQSTKVGELSDVTFAMKVITEEIRKTDADSIETGAGNESITLENNKTYTYNPANLSIEANDGSFTVRDIMKFYVKKSEDKVNIEITSVSNKTVKTEIVLRRGD